MCLSCGWYKGRLVMDLVAEKQKREARMKAKREMIRVEGSGSQNESAEQAAR